jgi:hypothetical protein
MHYIAQYFRSKCYKETDIDFVGEIIIDVTFTPFCYIHFSSNQGIMKTKTKRTISLKIYILNEIRQAM